MSLTGFHASNHPQQTADRGALAEVDDRATDWPVFNGIADRFGGFTLDVAASSENTKCPAFYTLTDDGLRQPWPGRIWCNPPYSHPNLERFIRKAWAEWTDATAELIVMLVPANRTEQPWWGDLIEPYRDRAGSPLRVEFLPGRLRFLKPGQQRIGANERPPFGCALLIWQRVGPAPIAVPEPLFDVHAEPTTSLPLEDR